MSIQLPADIEQLVAEGQGLATVQGQSATYIVMSDAAYREAMGVGSAEELRDSLAAIEQGLADAAAGRTRPFREVLSELRRGDALPG